MAAVREPSEPSMKPFRHACVQHRVVRVVVGAHLLQIFEG